MGPRTPSVVVERVGPGRQVEGAVEEGGQLPAGDSPVRAVPVVSGRVAALRQALQRHPHDVVLEHAGYVGEARGHRGGVDLQASAIGGGSHQRITAEAVPPGDVDQVDRPEIRVHRLHESERRRHVRRGEGRARPRPVASQRVDRRGHDLDPGRGQFHRLHPEVRPRRELVAAIGGGDGHHVRVGKSRRHEAAAVQVHPVVPGGGDDDDPGLLGVGDRIRQRSRMSRLATQRQVDDVGAHVRGVGDRPGHGEEVTARGARPDREDRHGRRHSHRAGAVERRGCHSGDFRAVADRVAGVVVVVDRVPAVDVVDQSVAVVVDAVVRAPRRGCGRSAWRTRCGSSGRRCRSRRSPRQGRPSSASTPSPPRARTGPIGPGPMALWRDPLRATPGGRSGPPRHPEERPPARLLSTPAPSAPPSRPG